MVTHHDFIVIDDRTPLRKGGFIKIQNTLIKFDKIKKRLKQKEQKGVVK